MQGSYVRYSFLFKSPVECVDLFINEDAVITDKGLLHARHILEKEYSIKCTDYELISMEEINLFGTNKRANPKFSFMN